jgi:hypothetical protein
MWKSLIQVGHYESARIDEVANADLERLLFLLATCRSITRKTLLEVLKAQPADSMETSCGLLLTHLLDIVRRHSSLQAAALLQRLVVDRLDIARHDELSRLFWATTIISEQCSIVSVAEQCMELIAELAPSHKSLTDHRRLILLNLMDTAYIIFVGDARCAQHALSVQSVEALIQVMSPSQLSVEIDDAGADVNASRDWHGNEDDCSTPAANNLSRLDASIFVFEEKVPPCQGWDPSIRIASATLLAILGTCHGTSTEQGGEVAMLKGRISHAVHSFVASASWFSTSLSDSADTSTGLPTFDMARRRLRFVAAFIAPDNEENMASLAHGADLSSRRSVYHLKRDLEGCHEAIEKYGAMEKEFAATRKALESRLAAKSILFDRQMADWKGLVEREAKALVQVHTSERQKADIQASQFSRQLADAQRTVQECQEAEKHSKTSLDNATSELNAIVAREESLARRVELSEAEVRKLSEELRATKALQGRTQVTEKELRARISDQDELIEQLECSESEIRESLENLFGDMVSLAQLYIMKEKEEAAYRESAESRLEKLQQRLESERKRNAELEARDKRNQYENEVLSKNYAKAREKLDKEREERRKEADQRRKRSGPISYINQLHSNVDRDTSRKGSSSSTGSKENNNSASASGSASRSKSSSAR